MFIAMHDIDETIPGEYKGNPLPDTIYSVDLDRNHTEIVELKFVKRYHVIANIFDTIEKKEITYDYFILLFTDSIMCNYIALTPSEINSVIKNNNKLYMKDKDKALKTLQLCLEFNLEYEKLPKSEYIILNLEKEFEN